MTITKREVKALDSAIEDGRFNDGIFFLSSDYWGGSIQIRVEVNCLDNDFYKDGQLSKELVKELVDEKKEDLIINIENFLRHCGVDELDFVKEAIDEAELIYKDIFDKDCVWFGFTFMTNPEDFYE